MDREHAPLDPAEILRELANAGVPWALLCLDECDSTNREALARATPEGLGVFAGWQSAGRGRRGARWQSERDADLLFSVAFRPELPTEKWSRLTHIAALAACKALEPDFEPKIKWPNDIYLDGKKVAGILVESEPASGLAVIGIGLNVNSDPGALGDELAAPATSLRAEAGSTIDRNELAVSLLRELYGQLSRPAEAFRDLLDEIYPRSLLIKQDIVATLPSGEVVTGFLFDLGDEGELWIEVPGGSNRSISSASQVRLLESVGGSG